MEKEIVHQTPSFLRIFSSALFDAVSLVLLTFLLFSGALPLYQKTSAYVQNSAFREDVMLSSRLYVSYDGGVKTLPSYLKDDSSLTAGQKDERLRGALDHCYLVYLNEEFDSKGQQRLLSFLSNYESDGEKLFDEEGNRALTSLDYDSVYYSCYAEIIESKAVVDLSKKEGFSEARRNILIGYGVSFLLTFAFSSLALFYVVPFCFHRGKKTFGMALTRIGYVDRFALSPTWARFSLRFLFSWALILLGGFFTFGVTWALSAAFCVFRKDRQSISDYIAAVYLVDDQGKKIAETFKYE